MKHICLYFQIHQPFRLKRYRFFDIGNDHYYYDDFRNEEIMRRITQKCYLPANLLLKEIIAEHPEFRVAFSISGTALEQLESYSPEALDTFRDLAETGCVEFLAETYAHSLSSLYDPEEFYNQTMIHSRRMEELFGVKPRVLRNTELIFSDNIATQVAEMGFQGMLTEGAKHILEESELSVQSRIRSGVVPLAPQSEAERCHQCHVHPLRLERISTDGRQDDPLDRRDSRRGADIQSLHELRSLGIAPSAGVGYFRFLSCTPFFGEKERRSQVRYAIGVDRVLQPRSQVLLHLPHKLGRRRKRYRYVAGQCAATRSMRQTRTMGRTCTYDRRSAYATGLALPTECRPLLLYENPWRRRRQLQPVRNALRCFQQLYECAQRLPASRRSPLPFYDRK